MTNEVATTQLVEWLLARLLDVEQRATPGSSEHRLAALVHRTIRRVFSSHPDWDESWRP